MVDCAVVALWGDEHEELGDIATASLDDATAIALSRGRFPKGYEYVDPNEDAVLAAADPNGRRLLAAADGHNGFEAARAAVETVAAAAPALLEEQRNPAHALQEAFAAASVAIAKVLGAATGRRRWGGTALSLALLTDDRGWTATLGDTVALRARGGRAALVSRRAPFLVAGSPPPPVDSFKLRSGDRVVMLTDGVTDFLGVRWEQRVAADILSDSAAEAAAQSVIESAMRGGAGDNCGVALALPRIGG